MASFLVKLEFCSKNQQISVPNHPCLSEESERQTVWTKPIDLNLNHSHGL